MVARLILGLAALVAVVSVAVAAVYRYWDRRAEREHEREMKRLEQRDALVEAAESESEPGPRESHASAPERETDEPE